MIDGEVPGHVPDFGVSLMEGGLIGFGIGHPCRDTTLKSQRRVDDEKWHHVVVTRHYESREIKIYIDGALDA